MLGLTSILIYFPSISSMFIYRLRFLGPSYFSSCALLEGNSFWSRLLRFTYLICEEGIFVFGQGLQEDLVEQEADIRAVLCGHLEVLGLQFLPQILGLCIFDRRIGEVHFVADQVEPDFFLFVFLDEIMPDFDGSKGVYVLIYKIINWIGRRSKGLRCCLSGSPG